MQTGRLFAGFVLGVCQQTLILSFLSDYFDLPCDCRISTVNKVCLIERTSKHRKLAVVTILCHVFPSSCCLWKFRPIIVSL